jgi:hypothetical protein
MQKSRKTKLRLDRETIKRLDSQQLARVAGGGTVPQPTVMNTHCQSCLGRIIPNCISDDCSVLC